MAHLWRQGEVPPFEFLVLAARQMPSRGRWAPPRTTRPTTFPHPIQLVGTPPATVLQVDPSCNRYEISMSSRISRILMEAGMKV